MWIKNIKIKNFRNYDQEEINLEKNINIFYGKNAQGKTNIIEAIFLCSLGKSFRAKKDNEMIKLNEENAIVEIEYEKSDRDGKIKIEIGNKKNIYLNGIKIKKLSELLGNLNIVIFTPDDINILKGGPQNRRRFLDIMISQLRPNYMHILNLYLKTIEQRNKYLRQIKEEHKDENLLEIWDEKLAEYAVKIYEYSETAEIKSKNIVNNQCVIIIFDMTKRKSFSDILDKYIKYLREIKYNNEIILFGKGDSNAIPMTDEQEINYLIEITKIKADFFDLRNKDKQEICQLIDKLIEKIFESSQKNANKKDCVIF